MKLLRIHSDLHLECYGISYQELADTLIPPFKYDADSILVLAGDISSKHTIVNFLKIVEKRFAHVLYIPGNHEYYRHDYGVRNAELEKDFKELEKTSYALGEVKAFVINGVRYILGTLWADGGKTPLERAMVQAGLNDFRLIRKNNHKDVFHVNDMMKVHCEQAAEIERLLEEPFDGATVVVTHHLPSYSLCAERFSTEINGGFASDVSYLMHGPSAPKFWIFGHTHDQIRKQIFDTVCISNPHGYPSEKSPFPGEDVLLVDLDE